MQILSTVLSVMPILLVFVVGGALAAMNLERHPMPARLSLAGFVIMALTLIASQVATTLLINWGLDAFPGEVFGWLMAGTGLLTSFVTMLGLLAVGAAVWSGREET